MLQLKKLIFFIASALIFIFAGCNQNPPVNSSTQTQDPKNTGNDNNPQDNNPQDNNETDFLEFSLDMSNLSSGWSSSYDSNKKTITFDEPWSGRGWWFGDFDASLYDSVEISFKSTTSTVALQIEYNNGEKADKFAQAGSTNISLELSATGKSSLKQIYLQYSEAGTIILTKAVLKGNKESSNTNTSNNNDDNNNNTETSDYNLDMNNLGSGWSSSYNSSTKTITFDEPWSGRGWWFGNFDASLYNFVEISFIETNSTVKLVVEYNNGEKSEQQIQAGVNKISVELSSSGKSSIQQIYLQYGDAGNLILSNAVLKKDGNSNTEYNNDDPQNNGEQSPLPAPQNLKVTSTTTSSITISFDEVYGASTYKVWWGKNSSISSAKSGSTNKTNCTISNLDSDTVYYIWVAAYDGSNNQGEISNLVSGKTQKENNSSGENQGSGTSSSSPKITDLVGGEDNGYERFGLEKDKFHLSNDKQGIYIKDNIGEDYGNLRIILYRSTSSDKNDLSSYKKIDSTTTSQIGNFTLVDNTINFDNSSIYYYILVIEDENGRCISKNVAQLSLRTDPYVDISFSDTNKYYYYAINDYSNYNDFANDDSAFMGRKGSAKYKYGPGVKAGNHNVWLKVSKGDWKKIHQNYTFSNGIHYTISSSNDSISEKLYEKALTLLTLDAE